MYPRPPAETGALGWSITAMRETTGRLLRATDWDRANGFAVISEGVWWVTMVDATLVRYHLDIHGRVLAGQDPGQWRITEDVFAGLRFVRNRMGDDTDPADFIQPLDTRPGAGRIAAWTWRSVPEPALGSLTPGAREWEMTRYWAYQAQLAGQPIGETFRRATAFLGLAADGSRLSRTQQDLDPRPRAFPGASSQRAVSPHGAGLPGNELNPFSSVILRRTCAKE